MSELVNDSDLDHTAEHCAVVPAELVPTQPGPEGSGFSSLKDKIAALQDMLAKADATLARAEANTAEQNDRTNDLMVELLRTMADTMAAKEMAARLRGELTVQKRRALWKRLMG
jgi:hypothetical protein